MGEQTAGRPPPHRELQEEQGPGVWGKQEERVWAPCGMEDEALCSLTQL